MEKLLLQIQKAVAGTDYKSGRAFKFDKLYVLINNIKIVLKVTGTAYDAVHQAMDEGLELVVQTKKGEYTDEETKEVTPYDAFYTMIYGEEIPLKAADRLGKKLILKKLGSGMVIK